MANLKLSLKIIFIKKTGNIDNDILEFCSIPRTRTELIEFTGISRYHTMSSIVQPLIDANKLEMTLPEKPKSSKQRFVKVKR